MSENEILKVEVEALKERVASLETLLWNVGVFLKTYVDQKDLNSFTQRGQAGDLIEEHKIILDAVQK